GNPVYTVAVSTDLRIVGAPDDKIGQSLSASDVNGDGVDEIFFGTPFNSNPPSTGTGTAYVFALVAGDVDGDGDADLGDYMLFAGCIAGPGVDVPPIGCTQEQFRLTDFDRDTDVDVADFATFQEAFTGPLP
ncbi:MAG: FG-GAP repeat protein, partial [Phycisphaerales bacterium]